MLYCHGGGGGGGGVGGLLSSYTGIVLGSHQHREGAARGRGQQSPEEQCK
jgi:hypothetical protein